MRHFSTIAPARPNGRGTYPANRNDRPGGAVAQRAWPATAPEALVDRIAPLLATGGLAPQVLWSELRDWLLAEGAMPAPVPPVVVAVPAVNPSGRRLPPTLVVTTRAEALGGQIAALSAGGAVDAGRVALEDLAGTLASEPEAWSLVMIDVDAYGSVGTIFDELLAIRAVATVPVILLSAQFCDDLTLERLPLCDASLRMPVAADRLTAAIAQAEVNNLVWRARKARLDA